MINKVYQANLFIGTDTYLGLAEEMDVPGPTATVTTHETISSLATLNLVTGFDLMEGRIKWKGMDELIEKYTANVFETFDMRVRYQIEKRAGSANMQRIGGTYFMRVNFRNAPNANFGAKTDVESETAYDCVYIRKEVGGRALFEFDPINYIYKVNGVDMLADLRRNLGL